jgi:cation diffusion facilitator family transporter
MVTVLKSIDPAHSATKRNAALGSALAAATMTTFKLAVGLFTGSLGMLSDATHSAVDMIASFLTLFSVRVADRPADESHTYGHGKVESLTAFIETVLMLGSAVWIVYEAVHRIVTREQLAVRLSIWPFVVLLLSLAVDMTRVRALRRVAQQTKSPALEADALHFSTDMWSTTAVLIGLLCTYIGERLHRPEMQFADPIAALLVSCIIVRVTIRMARQTIDALLDATPAELGPHVRAELGRTLAQLDGIMRVHRIRIRRSGAAYFVDLNLGLPRMLTFQRSEQITNAATDAVRRIVPGADVVVHSIPTASLAESVHDRVRAVAADANLSIHDLSVQQIEDKLHLEQHLEVNETMSLSEAHSLVTQLESDIHREVPEVGSILTHIESEPATIEQTQMLELDRTLEERLRAVSKTIPEIQDIHDIVITRHGDRLQMSCHVTLPDALPMGQVHDLITQLENAYKHVAPEVARLLIHPEPATDNRR